MTPDMHTMSMEDLTRIVLSFTESRCDGHSRCGVPHSAINEVLRRAAASSVEQNEDTVRLAVIAGDVNGGQPFDAIYNVDIHERAGEIATKAGRDEPTDGDYLAALRSAIDAEVERRSGCDCGGRWNGDPAYDATCNKCGKRTGWLI